MRAWGVLAVVALVACGGEVRSEPAEDATTTAPSPIQSGGASSALSGINYIANWSDAGVVATIVEVGPERWNSPDGRPWTEQGSDDPVPLLMRDVTVRVKSVVFDSAELDVEVGEIMPFCALELDGPVEPGADRLLLLSVWDQPMPGGTTERVNQLVASDQGTWRVEGPTAVSNRPERTVPLEDLALRLLFEREVGHDRSRDPATMDDPLAGEGPPAGWQPTRAHEV